jgi:hypothetical protein
VTPAEYMREILDPTLSDLASNPSSRRHAFLACAAAFHALDHLARDRPRAILRAQYRRQSPAFAAIDRIAHARDLRFLSGQWASDVGGEQPVAAPGFPAGLGATPGARKTAFELVSEAAAFLRNQIGAQSVAPSRTSNDAYYVVVPFDRTKEGDICPGAAQVVTSAHAARRRARTLAGDHAGAIAFSRAGDSETGEFEDAVILARFGDVDLKTLSR